MIISDRGILERISRPTDDRITIDHIESGSDIQAASIDLHLDMKLLEFSEWTWFDYFLFKYPMLQRLFRKPRMIDIVEGHIPEMYEVSCANPYILWPGGCVLGSTKEWIEVPPDLAAKVEGKSSLGRIFLTAHVTAGFVDPGFKGNITLEIRNLNRLPIVLRDGMKISQLCFEMLDQEAERPYGSPGLNSKYQSSNGVRPARKAS